MLEVNLFLATVGDRMKTEIKTVYQILPFYIHAENVWVVHIYAVDIWHIIDARLKLKEWTLRVFSEIIDHVISKWWFQYVIF